MPLLPLVLKFHASRVRIAKTFENREQQKRTFLASRFFGERSRAKSVRPASFRDICEPYHVFLGYTRGTLRQSGQSWEWAWLARAKQRKWVSYVNVTGQNPYCGVHARIYNAQPRRISVARRFCPPIPT